MAATNKCLAQSNKSGTGSKATKKRGSLPAMSQRQDLLSGQRCRLLHDRWYVSSPPSSDVPAGPLPAMERGAAGVAALPRY